MQKEINAAVRNFRLHSIRFIEKFPHKGSNGK